MFFICKKNLIDLTWSSLPVVPRTIGHSQLLTLETSRLAAETKAAPSGSVEQL